MTAADTVLRTTPRHVDPGYVRDLALSDAKERAEDVACLLPPAGPLLSAEMPSALYDAHRRLGTAINRLSESQMRVDLCESRGGCR